MTPMTAAPSAPEGDTSPRRAARRRSIRERDDAKWFRILTLPWLAGFILLSVLPLVIGFGISLTNYNGISPDLARFVGAANYVRAFSDPAVYAAALRTAVFVIAYVPLNFLVALSLALLVTAGPRARGLFRATYYLPSVIPVVGAAFIWRALFNKDGGLVNQVLTRINPDWAVGWLDDFATPSLVAMALWLGIGLSTVLYIAALQGVPLELEQAARIDGASYRQRLWHVVFPQISPVIFYQVLIALIYALSVVVEPMLIGATGPAGVSSAGIPNDNVLLTVFTYQQMFSNLRFGYASALLWITFAASVIVTLLLFASRKYWVHSESGNI